MNSDLEEIRSIDCKCGEWEEFMYNMPRNSVTCFELISYDGDEGFYKCNRCGEISRSRLVTKEEDI